MKSSENISTLAAALVVAQKAFTPALKTAVNPHFKSKYVDLASAIEAAQPALLDNGIAVLQGTSGDIVGQSITVTTRLLHSSGEWLEDSLTLPAVNRGDFSAQSAGSAITYARRYSYMAILGFAPEDDDGNGASQPQGTQRAARPATPVSSAEPQSDYDDHDYGFDKPEPVPQVGPAIGTKAKVLYAIAMGKNWSTPAYREWINKLGYSKDADIPAARFNEIKSKLEAA